MTNIILYSAKFVHNEAEIGGMLFVYTIIIAISQYCNNTIMHNIIYNYNYYTKLWYPIIHSQRQQLFTITPQIIIQSSIILLWLIFMHEIIVIYNSRSQYNNNYFNRNLTFSGKTYIWEMHWPVHVTLSSRIRRSNNYYKLAFYTQQHT